MADGRVPSASCTSEEKLHYYLRFLKFHDGIKPKFTWLCTKENLSKFIYMVFAESASKETESDDSAVESEWCEDAHHNMHSLRAFGLSFKLYSTTKTLSIQGKDELNAKEKLFGLIKKVVIDGNSTIEEEDKNGAIDESQKDDPNNSLSSIVEVDSRPVPSDYDDLKGEIAKIKENYINLFAKVEMLAGQGKRQRPQQASALISTNLRKSKN